MKLKTWLVENNIKQRDIAKDLQIDPSRVSKCINGITRFSGGQTVALANYLNVMPEDILNDNLPTKTKGRKNGNRE